MAGLVWLPYLPAVVTYLHPIFGSMNLRPDVVPVEHGFVLDPLTVIQWENVESAIQVVTEGLLSSASTAQHPPPFFPSSYGYRDTFPTRKRAKNAIKPSVLAFHHVLAYCSYLVASLDFPRERLESFYEDLTNAPPTLQNIMTNNGSGVVLKLLWSTLGEMHRARNFSGIVVSYNRPYNYKSIQRMQGYGVPVFVQWSCSARSQSYREFPQAEILDKWCPSPDSFAILCPGQSFTRSVSHAPSAQHPIPLPPPVPTPIESHGRCPWSHRCTLGLSHTSLSEDTVHAASGSAADENEAGFPAEESHSNTAIRSGPLHSSCVSSLELMGLWRDVGEFLYVRYGVSYISEVVDPRKDAKWSAVLGICCSPAASLVDLYNCVTRGRWPYGSCDLSLDLARANLLPGPSADYPIHSTPLPGSQGYLISVAEAWGVSWKLIVRDPLTVLQIEREGWVCPDGLIGGMIRKGVPFRILNPVKLEGEEVCGNRGPVVYTDGNEPERVAYLVYREQLRRFFTDNPHAYSAALSAGGILWRIAMDVLPALNAEAVVRPFHPGRCTLSTIDGKEYWTPWLTPLEKDVVVGVQRGLTCKLTLVPFLRPLAHSWQLPMAVVGSIAYGQSLRPGTNLALSSVHGLRSTKSGMLAGHLSLR